MTDQTVQLNTDTRKKILNYALQEGISEKEAAKQLITNGINQVKLNGLNTKRGDELLEDNK